MPHKLLCLDMDGVLLQCKSFWHELHIALGTDKERITLNKAYLHTDYATLVEEVVGKLWKGKDAQSYFDLVASIPYMKGIQAFFLAAREKKYTIAIVSASSIHAAERVKRDFGVDHLFANELKVQDGKLSGKFIWPVGEGTTNKEYIVRDLCKKLGLSLQDVVFVGDGSNDVNVCKVVGTSIAFNSTCEELRTSATHVIDSDDLTDVISYL